MINENPELYAPEMMRKLKRWCFYRLEKRKGKDKPTKVPYSASHGRRYAKTNDPSTWGTIDEAIATGIKSNGDGVSFMMQKADGLVFIDLDDCIDGETGELTRLAEYWVDRFDSYTEVSQSGTGLHILIKAKMTGQGNKDDSLGVEVYYQLRQICMCPNVFGDHDKINEAQDALNEFLNTFFPDRDQETPTNTIAPVVQGQPPIKDNDTLESVITEFCSREARLAVWEQRRTDDLSGDVSQSGIDFSIALNGLRMGLSHEVIGALIHRNREIYGDAKKGKRVDYLKRTIDAAIAHVNNELKKDRVMAENNNVVSIGFMERSKVITNAAGERMHKEVATQPEIAPDSLGSQFKLLTCDQVQELVCEVDWLARDYIPLDSIAWFFGKPSAGKSFAIISLAMSVAVGSPWGHIPVKRGGVLYVCGEGLSGLGKRFKGIRNEYFVRESPKNLLITNEPVIFTSEKHVLALIDRARDEFDGVARDPLNLLIIDTKNANMLGNESDSEVMTVFIRNLRRIQRAFKCAVVVVDHVGHGEGKRTRGSTVQLGAAEVAYLFEREDEEKTQPAPHLAFVSVMSVHKPPKDFESPQELEFKAQVKDISQGEVTRTTLVMVPSPPRVTVCERPNINHLTRSELSVYESLLDCMKAVKTGDKEKREKITLNAWRKACDAHEFSRQTLHRAMNKLIEKEYVLCIPPKEGKQANKNDWYVWSLIDD